MKPARVEIAAPGAQGVAVIRAPFAVEPESKRGTNATTLMRPIAPLLAHLTSPLPTSPPTSTTPHLLPPTSLPRLLTPPPLLGPGCAVSKIENQEISLKDELIILEDGTKARNREFYRQLDAISERGRNWEQKLALEIKAQRKAQKELASFFEVTLADAVQHERKALFDTIENFHNEVIPPQDRRMADNEKEVEVFVSETVPDIIDRQSGIVSRKLKKAHDTFDVRTPPPPPPPPQAAVRCLLPPCPPAPSPPPPPRPTNAHHPCDRLIIDREREGYEAGGEDHLALPAARRAHGAGV